MAGINPATTLRVNPAMTSGALHTIPHFPDSLFKQRRCVGHASSPVFFAAPGTPSSLLSPLDIRGDGAPGGATIVLCCRTPSREHGRLPARHHGFLLTAPGRAFRWPLHFLETAMRQPAPGRRLLLATGRSPGAARVRALRKARARAPHPIPPA